MNKNRSEQNPVSRRGLLRSAVGAAALTAIGGRAESAEKKVAVDRVVKNGRIKQSLVSWCYMSHGEKWNIEQICEVATGLGCVSIELISPKHWPTLKKHGLTCAIASHGIPGMGFRKGFNNVDNHAILIPGMKRIIDECADGGVKRVITFNGFKWRDPGDPASGEISLEEGAANCVTGIKQIVGHAEKKGVTVCIEMLNSRDDSHPMKGHPGYQGDDVDYVADIIRKVDSPNFKMLFDIYHVQIMNGDVIRRIGECKDIIGHIHTAGNPGRGELDENQELWYPAIMRKLVEVGYDGYVGHEFIPTYDPLVGLKQACTLCDV